MWLVHAGRIGEVSGHLEVVESIAARRDDDTLHGLAGLIRGWVHLGTGSPDRSITALSAIRELGGDFHQHHFVDMYLGLSQFRLGAYPRAADQWYAAMRKALAVRHSRGVAGSIEGCGYIAERLGRASEACQCMGAAEEIRKRAGSPLFSFWIQHHEFANRELRTVLGTHEYDAGIAAGARLREEDAANQAAALLREFSATAVGAITSRDITPDGNSLGNSN
jgi:hypothetical protein